MNKEPTNVVISTKPSTAYDEARMRQDNARHSEEVDRVRSAADRRRTIGRAGFMAALIPVTVVAVGLQKGPGESDHTPTAPPVAAEQSHDSTPTGQFDLDDRDAAIAYSQNAAEENREYKEDQRMAEIGRNGGVDPNEQSQG